MEKPAARILCPYSILYGGRGWLVAHVDELPEMRLWRLDRIVSIDLLDRGFARRGDFDLSAYAAQFQEAPIDVVLRFEPEAADDAAGWLFHPSQSVEREPGGALIVCFLAGGVQEMCWHLFTRGTASSSAFRGNQPAPPPSRSVTAGTPARTASRAGQIAPFGPQAVSPRFDTGYYTTSILARRGAPSKTQNSGRTTSDQENIFFR